MPKFPPPAPLYMEPRVLCSCGSVLTVRRVFFDHKELFGTAVVQCSSGECANRGKLIGVKIAPHEAELINAAG